MNAPEGNALFKDLVDNCGLAKMFAGNSVKRACERAGTTPDAVTPSDLPKVIEELKTAIEMFTPETVDASIERLRALGSG